MVDFISPEERVKARRKVLDDFIDVAQPAQQAQNKAQRDQLKQQVAASTVQQTQNPQLQGLGSLGVIQQASGAGMQMLGQQAQQQDALNAQGAGMQQNIAAAKNQQAVQNVSAGLESNIQRMARAVADRAFAEGLEAKKLIFHENAALSDYAMERLALDFRAGRVNKTELQRLQIALTERATQKKYAADQALAKALGEFKAEMARGNAERAKARLLAALEAQRDALKDGVKASSIANVISGTAGATSAILVNKYFGSTAPATSGTTASSPYPAVPLSQLQGMNPKLVNTPVE